VIEFPKPDPALQKKLWARLIDALAGPEAARKLVPMAESLSLSIEVTGAQIKFAVLNAVFAAQAESRPVQARHILAGLNRELSKEGRSLGSREYAKILQHAGGSHEN